MTIEEYYEALKYHDWYYEYSDDHGVWKKGADNETRLAQESATSPQHERLWLAFNAWKQGPHHKDMPTIAEALCFVAA